MNADQLAVDDPLTSPEASGERFLPGMPGSIEAEHLHRYQFAATAVRGKRVLDIACGDGYGSALLARSAERVVGVDIDIASIARARRLYRRPNLSFATGDCAAIPLADGSIDVVVSYETLEHHDQHETMFSEIRRVLKPKGLLIISTPDRHEYSEVPNYANPYHVLELSKAEFATMVKRYFANATLFGQKPVQGSLIAPLALDETVADWFVIDAAKASHPARVSRPLYLIALASDGRLPKMTIGCHEDGDRSMLAGAGDSSRLGMAKLYWACNDGLFTEVRSGAWQIVLDSVWQMISFSFPASDESVYLRFDPLEQSGAFAVAAMEIREDDGSVTRLGPRSELAGHSNDIEWEADASTDCHCGISTGEDPFFVVAIPALAAGRVGSRRFVAAVSYPARIGDLQPLANNRPRPDATILSD